MKKTGFLFALIITHNLLFAQSILQKADMAFEDKNYFEAINSYKTALTKEKDKTITQTIKFRIGESYRFGNDFENAVIWYEKVISSDYSEPSIYYNYANTLLMTGNYIEAKNFFEKYLKNNPQDKKVILKIKSCDFALQHAGEKPVYRVTNENSLNSKYSEYGITKISKKIVFSSSRIEKNDKLDPYTGHAFSDFYETEFDKRSQKWKPPLKCKGGINSKYNDGAICYSRRLGKAYVMQCNKGGKPICSIYESELDLNKFTWGGAKSIGYSHEGYSIGHPALSGNGRTLYFVSDMPGGLGGTDIWKMKKSYEGEWGKPVNLGKNINTAGDEMFPYLYQDTIFYFSSNGNIGFGGLDIYVSKIRENSFIPAVGLEQPLNSSADDFGIFYLGQDSGLFSSNRIGGVGSDDIYKFTLIPPTMIPIIYKAEGKITIKNTKKPLADAIITLKGNDRSVFTAKSDANGNFSIASVVPDVKYKISVAKKGFLGNSKSFKTYGKEKYAEKEENDPAREYIKSLDKNLDFQLIQITKDEIEIPNIYYDYDKAELTDTSKLELNKLIKILNENPKIYIVVNSHTDNRGAEEYNLKLSDERAQSVVNHLVENKINNNRLAAKGWGETKLLNQDAKTEEEHQVNRRTTFNIITAKELAALKVVTTTVEKVDNAKVDYRVLFSESKSMLPPKFLQKIEKSIKDFKPEYEKTKDNKYRYTIGSFDNFKSAQKILKKVQDTGFKKAKIIAFREDKIIPLSEARKLLGK